MSTSQDLHEEKGRLRFLNYARNAFSFIQQRGYREVMSRSTSLRFESQRVFLSVYHDLASYQVGVEMGPLDGTGRRYSLYELLKALAPDEVEKARLQTTDPQVLERSLMAVADVIERTCEALLAGDASDFARLDAAVASGRNRATLEAEFGATMDEADRAWQAKDYTRAKTLYKKAEPALSSAQKRRLKYLNSKLRS